MEKPSNSVLTQKKLWRIEDTNNYNRVLKLSTLTSMFIFVLAWSTGEMGPSTLVLLSISHRFLVCQEKRLFFSTYYVNLLGFTRKSVCVLMDLLGFSSELWEIASSSY